jgi:oxygen-independent coproporphyrinogen-3 oxidase
MSTARPLGVYIHVPFCRIHCPYCDFYTYPSERGRDADFVSALLCEIELSRYRLDVAGHEVNTIYFGGGTPSLLSNAQIGDVLTAARHMFSQSDTAEITLEMNPEDVTPARLDDLADVGVNRISLGVQSLRQSVLNDLGRIHTVAQARTSLETISGYRNWNADLMFGWAGQTVADFERELDELLAYEPSHVSLYELTIEPRTRFGVLAAQGRLETVDADRQAELYLSAVEILEANGLRQYEVSNFAREGHRSRHNLACWRRQPYVGLGPSACSQLWSRRTQNTRSLVTYLTRLAGRDTPVTFVEVLTPAMEHVERIWLGLRTCDGVSRDLFGKHSQNVLDKLVDENLAINRPDQSYALSANGMAMADDIVGRILLTETQTNSIPRHLSY